MGVGGNERPKGDPIRLPVGCPPVSRPSLTHHKGHRGRTLGHLTPLGQCRRMVRKPGRYNRSGVSRSLTREQSKKVRVPPITEKEEVTPRRYSWGLTFVL